MQGDVSETVSTFHESSSLIKPLKKSLLSLQDVSNNFSYYVLLRFLCEKKHLMLIWKISSVDKGLLIYIQVHV